ncbi:hypothetical protein CO676_20635 [Sinorhizobium sp. BJ1]|nr:hypothetical protein CO676_20635 [Sinorhizobium sp. BJ1]
MPVAKWLQQFFCCRRVLFGTMQRQNGGAVEMTIYFTAATERAGLLDAYAEPYSSIVVAAAESRVFR